MNQATRHQLVQLVVELARTQRITPNLWFDDQAEEAAGFYTDDFENSRIITIVQKGFPSAEGRDAFAAGLPGTFDRLERLAQARPDRRAGGA